MDNIKVLDNLDLKERRKYNDLLEKRLKMNTKHNKKIAKIDRDLDRLYHLAQSRG